MNSDICTYSCNCHPDKNVTFLYYTWSDTISLQSDKLKMYTKNHTEITKIKKQRVITNNQQGRYRITRTFN